MFAKRFMLTEFSIADASLWKNIAYDSQTEKWAPMFYLNSEEDVYFQLHRFNRATNHQMADKETPAPGLYLAIRDSLKPTEKGRYPIIGGIVATEHNSDDKDLDVVMALTKEYQRQEVVFEVMAEFVLRAKREGYKKVRLDVHSSNLLYLKCLLKMGMSVAGNIVKGGTGRQIIFVATL